MRIPDRRYSWSKLDLFRFSAATGNAHRIHYDVEHARAEGLDSVVVHTTLHATMLWQTLTAAVDEHAVRRFSWRNHAPLVAGRLVVVSAMAEVADGGWQVTLVERTEEDGARVASGQAFVVDDRCGPRSALDLRYSVSPLPSPAPHAMPDAIRGREDFGSWSTGSTVP